MRMCIQSNDEQNIGAVNTLPLLVFDELCTDINASDAIFFPVLGEVRLFSPRPLLLHVFFVNTAYGTQRRITEVMKSSVAVRSLKV
jgi:hypothetical protein